MEEKHTLWTLIKSNIPLIIGGTGFLTGLGSLFIDLSWQLSIKWLLGILLVAINLTSILIKIICDLSKATAPSPPYGRPIQYVQEQNIFIIRRNDNFINSIVVGCYCTRDEMETLAYIGVVHMVQDKIIQILIIKNLDILPSVPSSKEELRTIIIRPVLPIKAIEQLSSLER